MGDYTQVPNPPADSVPAASASAVPSVPLSNPPADPIAPDPNRPVSTLPADATHQTLQAGIPADLSPEALAKEDSPQASSSAQPDPADSQTQPVPVPDLQPDQVLEGSASAEITSPADSETTASGSIDSPPPIPQSPQPPESPQSSDVLAPTVLLTPTVHQSPSVSIPVDPPKESSIQDAPPANQPSQVQPEAPQNTPVTQGENTPSQSAGIKPEPPQGTQNAPPAVSKNTESPKPTSFGDLMGTPADLSEEPAIHIDPIEAPPIAPVTPPVIPPTQPTDENQQAALVLRRQHAVEARKQKREENLAKILDLAQKKGTVNNLDVRDFLHISQTTATDYLRTLVNSGKLKKAGKAKATIYSL